MPDAISGLKRVSFGCLDAFIVILAMGWQATEANTITNLEVMGDTGPLLRGHFAVRSNGLILSYSIDKALVYITADEHHEIYKK